MITKNALEASILHECNVCKHLYTKLPESSFEYRPTAAQRSTLELLRYLAVVGVASVNSLKGSDWSVWREYSSRAAAMTPEEFPEMMDRQIGELREFFAGISQEELDTKIVRLPTGTEEPFGQALMNSVLKWFTAYKMQLFLYAKMNGVENIGTANCWGGFDMPARKPKVEEEAAA